MAAQAEVNKNALTFDEDNFKKKRHFNIAANMTLNTMVSFVILLIVRTARIACAGGRAGRQAGRQEGRQAGRKAGRQAGRVTHTHTHTSLSLSFPRSHKRVIVTSPILKS